MGKGDNVVKGPWGGAPQVIEGDKTAHGGDEPPNGGTTNITIPNVVLLFLTSLFMAVPVILLTFALRLGWLLAEKIAG